MALFKLKLMSELHVRVNLKSEHLGHSLFSYQAAPIMMQSDCGSMSAQAGRS
jgi:hypothetical protein